VLAPFSHPLYLGKGKSHAKSVGILYTENCIGTTKQEKSIKIGWKNKWSTYKNRNHPFWHLVPLVSVVHFRLKKIWTL